MCVVCPNSGQALPPDNGSIPDKRAYRTNEVLLQMSGYPTYPALGDLFGERAHIAQVRGRIERAYLDKIDGKISEEFWEARASDWNREEQQILMAMQGLEQQSPERILDGVKILELANKAYFLYVKQPPAEQARLLKLVLSNCSMDATSIHPTYKKPFDLIFARAKNDEWRARRDSNPRPSGS